MEHCIILFCIGVLCCLVALSAIRAFYYNHICSPRFSVFRLHGNDTHKTLWELLILNANLFAYLTHGKSFFNIPSSYRWTFLIGSSWFVYQVEMKDTTLRAVHWISNFTWTESKCIHSLHMPKIHAQVHAYADCCIFTSLPITPLAMICASLI